MGVLCYLAVNNCRRLFNRCQSLQSTNECISNSSEWCGLPSLNQGVLNIALQCAGYLLFYSEAASKFWSHRKAWESRDRGLLKMMASPPTENALYCWS